MITYAYACLARPWVLALILRIKFSSGVFHHAYPGMNFVESTANNRFHAYKFNYNSVASNHIAKFYVRIKIISNSVSRL